GRKAPPSGRLRKVGVRFVFFQGRGGHKAVRLAWGVHLPCSEPTQSVEVMGWQEDRRLLGGERLDPTGGPSRPPSSGFNQIGPRCGRHPIILPLKLRTQRPARAT